MVHAGCGFVAGIHPSRTRMSGSLESVWWNACMHRLDLSLFSHPKELSDWVRQQVWLQERQQSFPSSSSRGSSGYSSFLSAFIGVPISKSLVWLDPEKSTRYLVQSSHNQWGSESQNWKRHRAVWRPPDFREKTQTEVVRARHTIIWTGQDYPTGNSSRRETKTQTEETMGR